MYGPQIGNKQIATISEKVRKTKTKLGPQIYGFAELICGAPTFDFGKSQFIWSFRIETNLEGHPTP